MSKVSIAHPPITGIKKLGPGNASPYDPVQHTTIPAPSAAEEIDEPNYVSMSEPPSCRGMGWS